METGDNEGPDQNAYDRMQVCLSVLLRDIYEVSSRVLQDTQGQRGQSEG